ncbi:TIGR04141 family sporadically distributed protein [uncultured Roseobacter sp.]|uniref:DUF6119 family protein n=1 Tax=uncultured Roseobacter sp. TaxID=114847 RepID=UPI00260A4E75|nr:TIGR04141 family sporadically distributed protein [uncultured Roseobacter sp.]
MTKTKTFSLYLAKNDVTSFDDVLSETAKERLQAKDGIVSTSTELGDQATVFVFENQAKPPPWLGEVKSVFTGIPSITNKSSCAVVVFRASNRVFVTPFAHGWQYIDDAKIEMDFGLRVAINSLDDTKVKRVDRSHLGEALKGVSQSTFQRDLQAFGIDEALDLVRRVSGRVEGDDFARNLAGATALKVSREMSLSDMAEVASEALVRSEADTYRSTSFHIIDKVRPIMDPLVLAALDSEAVKIIKGDQEGFELSMPGWSEEDVVYYTMTGMPRGKRYPDLLMANYKQAIGDDLENLTVEAIARNHGVIAEFSNDAQAKKRWSIKRALIGSVVLEGGLYAISEGEWYRLDQQFKTDIDATFEELKEDWPSPPLVIKKLGSEDNKKTGFETELSYNQRCAVEYAQVCLDQKNLVVPTVPYGKFEACDLLDIEGKRLIHVKKSSRQSSVLSHFFKQGSNSARILKTFPEAREVMVEKVREVAGDDAAEQLSGQFGSSLAGWKVEFHIVDAPRSDGSFAIPFFSRITLREESRTLKGMELKVSIRFIKSLTIM